MVNVSCYNCASQSSTEYATENGYILVKCTQCGLLYLNPRPSDDEITSAHKVGKHRGAETLDVTGYFDHGKVAYYKKILSDFSYNEFLKVPKTWLDIGCGHGEFLLALHQFGQGKILTKGLEPNVNKQKSARARGLDVSDFDFSTHLNQYDVLSLLNVYSHLPDPPQNITDWKRNIKPGGELWIETGDTAHLTSQQHYRPFYLPDHLSFASEKIVVNILKRTGFEIMDIKKYPFVRRDFSVFVKELAKIFLPNKKSRFRYLINHQLYAKTNMFIRARLKE